MAPPPTVQAAMSGETIRRLLLAALMLGFALLVGVLGATAWLVARDQDYTGWVNHTYVVDRRLSRFATLFETTEAARRGYLLSHDPRYLTTYRNAATDLPRLLEQVQVLTADNPREQANTEQLQTLLTRKLDTLETSIQTAEAQPTPSNAQAVEADQATVDGIRRVLANMVAEETRLLNLRADRQGANAETLLVVVVGSGVLLAGLALAALYLVRRYAADLDRSRDDLRQLNEGLEQAVKERTGDLVRANEEIQRFAYIVSHDLRSPLVNVMGFTSELEASLKPLHAMLDEAEKSASTVASRDAATAIREDIPESIGFIRSSTQKMDRLINAILKLSREGRRTLNPEPVDMGAVISGVAASLQHQIADRGAAVEVEGELPRLVSDRLAVEQVFSNVIENALKYLKPGRPGRIVVRGREAGSGLVFEVEDNGRGIDPRDQERIFELFRRSGAQDQPGEGIGLAHVRALVYRLGGLITVESALDRGATFRLSLPRSLSREEGRPA